MNEWHISHPDQTQEMLKSTWWWSLRAAGPPGSDTPAACSDRWCSPEPTWGWWSWTDQDEGSAVGWATEKQAQYMNTIHESAFSVRSCIKSPVKHYYTQHLHTTLIWQTFMYEVRYLGKYIKWQLQQMDISTSRFYNLTIRVLTLNPVIQMFKEKLIYKL